MEGSAIVNDTPIHATEESVIHLFGRPKGTSMVNSRDLKELDRLTTNEAANTEFKTVREQAKLKNKRATRGMLTKIVTAAKQTYGVDPRTSISIHRFGKDEQKEAKNSAVDRGTPSPMLSVEPFFVELTNFPTRQDEIADQHDNWSSAGKLPHSCNLN